MHRLPSMKPDEVHYGDVDFSNPRSLNRKPYYQRRCSIMVTLMDAEMAAEDMQKLLEAGMNMTRFLMSNHTNKAKKQLLGRIKTAATNCCKRYGVEDWPITTAIDMKTFVMKTGLIDEDVPEAILKEGSEVILTYNLKYFNKCNPQRIFVDNIFLAVDAKVGSEIYIGHEEIMVVCKEIIDDKSIRCKVVLGGRLMDAAGVIIRGVVRTRPLMNPRDLERIQFALDNKIDIIIINYVREGEAISKTKELISKNKGHQPLILSGICTEQGLDHIDDIIKTSDAIVLSREYLPYELQSSRKYRISAIQKWVAAKCHQAGKPLFLSGAVFEHALRTGVFNNVEVADISNAILEGFSGFILRDCQDLSKTLNTIKFLDELCCAVEPFASSSTDFWELSNQLKLPLNAAEGCLLSCVTLANYVKARAIILPTLSGRTARLLLGMRPTCLVLAICTSRRVSRMLYLYKCIMPILYSSKIVNLTEALAKIFPNK